MWILHLLIMVPSGEWPSGKALESGSPELIPTGAGLHPIASYFYSKQG